MKKVLFAAFAGLCVITSIMATPAQKGNLRTVTQIQQSLKDTVPPGKDTTKKVSDVYVQEILNDTIPKKTDTSRSPKPMDTTSMPKIVQELN